MKNILILAVVFTLITSCGKEKNEISLSGEWNLRVDSLADATDIALLEYDRVIRLPGTLDEAGIGEAPGSDTSLTKKVLSTLTRKYNYVGPAYYSREISIPAKWDGTQITLTMERIIWKSTVWIDGVKAGTANSLSTPHYYNLTKLLTPGKHTITICIDNRRQVNINSSDFAHAYTNQTQIKWNGILGEFSLKSRPDRSIKNIALYPDYTSGKVTGKISLNGTGIDNALLEIVILDPEGNRAGFAEETINGEEIMFTVDITGELSGWNEMNPALYAIEVMLKDEQAKTVDAHRETFGFRNIDNRDGHIAINGEKIFLRGTLECSIFPLTGHPPVEVEEWKELFQKARNYGLNHLRFHSWCPPEAAFQAADEVGFYLQAELPSWSLSYGEDPKVVDYIEEEADRILREYGNHPSFVMLCMGNELMGDFDLINGLVKRLKESDNRRLYTATAFTFQQEHWGFHEPYDDYYITQWTDSGWVRGQGVFDQYPPSFRHNYDRAINYIEIPVISHEIGQYTVYPNLEEISKYTGVLEPRNFMAVRNDLQKKGRLEMAPKYTEATGKFATILYKEEIERAYKTAGLSGFQLLDLHDFPGQGTALVGMLDAFWDSKGFTTGEEFSEFCSAVVPLLWFDKAVYSTKETFRADAGVSNYHGDLTDTELEWSISDQGGNRLMSGSFTGETIHHGTVSKLGLIEESLEGIETPNCLTIELRLNGTAFKNSWKIWVYDDQTAEDPGDVFITASFEEAFNFLKEGRKVLLSPPLDQINGITGKFVPVFWSPVHFPNQPGTMGILCDPEHPVFNKFPTEFHSNWQWWDISKFSETLEIDQMNVEPLITVMDNFFKNRNLSNLFEVRVGNGTLIFSSIDLINHLDKRPAAQQLRKSVLYYMNSGEFNPQRSVTTDEIMKLYLVSESEAANLLSIYN